MSRTSNAFMRRTTPTEEMIHDVAAYRPPKQDEGECPSDPEPPGQGQVKPVIRATYHDIKEVPATTELATVS